MTRNIKLEWKENINSIKEIFPGQFQIILDFATTAFVQYTIRDDFKYVWVCNHSLQDYSNWERRNLPIFENQPNFDVISRHLQFDFVMPTNEFTQILPSIKDGVTLVQMNKLPKEYLDINRLKGKTLYDLLKNECEYLFELDIPVPTDYGTIVSPDRNYLQTLLDNPKIDWTNLP